MWILRDFIGTHKTLIPNKTLKIFKESNIFTCIEYSSYKIVTMNPWKKYKQMSSREKHMWILQDFIGKVKNSHRI